MPLGILDWDYQFHSWTKAGALRIKCWISLPAHSLEGSPVPRPKGYEVARFLSSAPLSPCPRPVPSSVFIETQALWWAFGNFIVSKINKPLDFRPPERLAERISTGIYIKIKWAFLNFPKPSSSDFHSFLIYSKWKKPKTKQKSLIECLFFYVPIKCCVFLPWTPCLSPVLRCSHALSSLQSLLKSCDISRHWIWS